MNKTYSLPPIAQIHFSSVSLLFALYISHAWLTSGDLNQHWKWPVLLDLPLSASPSLLQLILSSLNTSFTTCLALMGFVSPANLAENPYSRVCLSYQPSIINCLMRSNPFEARKLFLNILSIAISLRLFVFFFFIFIVSLSSFMILSGGWGELAKDK